MTNGKITSPRTRVEIAEDLGVSRDLVRLARYQLEKVREDLALANDRIAALEIELRANGGGK
jgi:hypothetical protein